MKERKYQHIAQNNQDLINRAIVYICCINNITREELLYSDNSSKYIKYALNSIRNNNNKAVKLRIIRKKVRDDLDDLERAVVQSEAFDGIGGGKTTGGKKNTVEIRQLNKIKLREGLGKLLTESLLLEKTLEQNNDLIRELINIIPRKQYIEVLDMTYIECMSNTRIAFELGYSTEFVDQARKRGVYDIVQIIKNMGSI